MMIICLLNQYLNDSSSDSNISSESSEMLRDKRRESETLTAVKKEIEIITIKTVTIRVRRDKLLILKSLSTVREREINKIYN